MKVAKRTQPQAEGGQEETQGCFGEKLLIGDLKKFWDSMKEAVNMTTNRRRLITDDDLQKANELNNFFMWFETQDFSWECDKVLQSINITDSSTRLIVNPFKILSLCVWG